MATETEIRLARNIIRLLDGNMGNTASIFEFKHLIWCFSSHDAKSEGPEFEYAEHVWQHAMYAKAFKNLSSALFDFAKTETSRHPPSKD